MESCMRKKSSTNGFEVPNGFWYSDLSLKDYLNQEPVKGRLYDILFEAVESSTNNDLYLNYAAFHIFESYKYRKVDSLGITVERIYVPDGVEIKQAWDSLESTHPEEVLTAAFEKANKDFGYFAGRVSHRLRRLEASH